MTTKKVTEHEYTVNYILETQIVVDEKNYQKLINKETLKIDPEKLNKIKEKDTKFFSTNVKKVKVFERDI